MLNFAMDTARQAGGVLLEKFGKKIDVSKKGDVNLVTEADLASEKLIIERIASHHPRHSILAEESGNSVTDASSKWKWIIDPLDGTTNFAHGYPCFSVTLALEHEGRVVVGVTYDPTRDEMFAAERGRGASLNNKSISVSSNEALIDSLVVTGFPYNFQEDSSLVDRLTRFLLKARGVRRDGSAAIDLAYVACGRFDAFWEDGLNPWDIGAGVLLVEEAGGRVTDYRGGAVDIYKPPICASNGRIHTQMLEILG